MEAIMKKRMIGSVYSRESDDDNREDVVYLNQTKFARRNRVRSYTGCESTTINNSRRKTPIFINTRMLNNIENYLNKQKASQT